MTKKLSECSYCKRPADEDGSIFHVGGCTGLQAVTLNRLQYDALQAEIEQLRGNLSLAEEGLANYAQENERLQDRCAEFEANLTIAERQVTEARMELDRRSAEPNSVHWSEAARAYRDAVKSSEQCPGCVAAWPRPNGSPWLHLSPQGERLCEDIDAINSASLRTNV